MEIKTKKPLISSNKGQVNYEQLIKDIKKHLSISGNKKQS